MRLTAIIAAVAASASFVSATPVNAAHEVHEKRSVIPNGWTRQRKVTGDTRLPMKIGLAQSNLDKGYEYLLDISDPVSPNYGKHWTQDEVVKAFAPSEETVNAVKAWLAEVGIGEDRVSHTGNRGWLRFDASVDEAESLLKTKYHLYEHAETGQPHIACEEYSLPAHIRKHVDFITPSVHFDTKIRGKGESAEELVKRNSKPNVGTSVGKPGTVTGGANIPKKGPTISIHDIITELENCDNQIVPDCLRALYEFLPNAIANPKNSFGIVEYTPESYLGSDLDMFFKNFSKSQVGDRPIEENIDGGFQQTSQIGFEYQGEPDLDLEYGMTLVYPQQVVVYQAGDDVEGASFNNFLDAIDASYCTYDGGDDPTQDAVYPDPAPGGYKGPEACGTFKPTNVISTSYAYNEADLTPFYENRQCNEYMKLGLMGVTIVYSSGDYGVAGNGGQCIDPATGQYNNGSSGEFNPSFPGTCPYITSVGATQVIPGTNIIEALLTGTQPEQASETVIYSGGGFSNVFPLPAYQRQAVKSYLKNYPPPYTAQQYNNSGMTRGYPDVSANGANYVIAVDGEFSLVYGTSCSAPVFGAIMTLVNEFRLDLGKKPVGFINPTIYAHPNVFNDVTKGTNQGCGTQGFSAEPGWDPVTGLGTPNFPKLVALFLSLP